MSNDSDGGRQRNWILSFADLLSLLLCFMVMSFAVSKVERDQRHQPAPATETISETTGWPARGQPSADAAKPTRVLDLDYLAAVLGAIIAGDRVLQGTHIERSDDRLVLAIPGDILFAPGETRIADEARPSFDALARVLDSISNPIGVFGHADRQPLPTGDEYPIGLGVVAGPRPGCRRTPRAIGTCPAGRLLWPCRHTPKWVTRKLGEAAAADGARHRPCRLRERGEMSSGNAQACRFASAGCHRHGLAAYDERGVGRRGSGGRNRPGRSRPSRAYLARSRRRVQRDT